MDEAVKNIKEHKRELFQEIQNFSRSKKKLWQKVLELAKERLLLGSEGSSPNMRMAAECGSWCVRFAYSITVDLKTGTLDGDIQDLILGLNPKEDLCPERVIRDLKKSIKNFEDEKRKFLDTEEEDESYG